MANFTPKLGLHDNLPAVSEGSFLITTDEREIYVDTSSGRTLLSNGKQEIEYIVGTQSAATNVWTGVTKESSLYTGKIIAYQLPYEGNNNAATLTLTLAGGGNTGAIGIRRQGTGTITKHYPANSIIFLIYDGTYWRTDGDYNSEPVSSVNSKTGHVVLTAADVGAISRNNDIISGDLIFQGDGTEPSLWLDANYIGFIKDNKSISITASNISSTATSTPLAPQVRISSRLSVSNGPIENSDVTTKKYVDDAISSAISGVDIPEYTGGTGITITTGNVINHTNSTTATTAFPTGTSASADGGTITVRDIKYDAQGHITGSQDRTITLSQANSSMATLTIGSYSYNGTSAISIPIYSGTISNTVNYVDGDNLGYGGN